MHTQGLSDAYSGLTSDYREYLRLLGYSRGSLVELPRYVLELCHYAQGRGLSQVEELDGSLLAVFFSAMCARKNLRSGGGLTPGYLRKYRQALRLLVMYLSKAYGMELAVRYERLPLVRRVPNLLSETEVKRLLSVCADNALGSRDRVMFSLLYGCGLRTGELLDLRVDDVKTDQGLVYIRRSKTGRSRYVPLGVKTKSYVSNYLRHVRGYFVRDPQETHLLLSSLGGRMHDSSVRLRLKSSLKAAGLSPDITPHSLRHSIATHLMERGMSLRHIALFLGHSCLDSTQIYTHVLSGKKSNRYARV